MASRPEYVVPLPPLIVRTLVVALVLFVIVPAVAAPLPASEATVWEKLAKFTTAGVKPPPSTVIAVPTGKTLLFDNAIFPERIFVVPVYVLCPPRVCTPVAPTMVFIVKFRLPVKVTTELRFVVAFDPLVIVKVAGVALEFVITPAAVFDPRLPS